jgi:hypothetical protein
VDSEGKVHRPLFSESRRYSVPAGELAAALEVAADDPEAVLVLHYSNVYMDDIWTLIYHNDHSDYYSI